MCAATNRKSDLAKFQKLIGSSQTVLEFAEDVGVGCDTLMTFQELPAGPQQGSSSSSGCGLDEATYTPSFFANMEGCSGNQINVCGADKRPC